MERKREKESNIERQGKREENGKIYPTDSNALRMSSYDRSSVAPERKLKQKPTIIHNISVLYILGLYANK